MQMLRHPVPLVLLMMTVLLNACKKDDDGPSGGSGGGGGVPGPVVQFTIDGDGFADEAITLSASTGSGNALYSTADDETSGNVTTSALDLFQLLFQGNSTGTQECSGGTGDVGLSFTINGQQYLNYTDTLVITEYGAVGDRIEGTFGGTVIRVNGSGAGTIATVTDGVFTFKRIDDI